MSMIVLPGARNRTPVGRMKIDWNNPLTHCLAAFVPLTRPGIYRDLVTGTVLSNAFSSARPRVIQARSGPYLGDSPRLGTTFPGTPGEYLIMPLSATGFPLSLACGLIIAGTVNPGRTYARWGQGSPSTDETAVRLRIASGPSLDIAGTTSTGTLSNASSTRVPLAYDTIRYMGVYASSTSRINYDGTLPAVTATASRTLTAPTELQIGTNWSGTAYNESVPNGIEYVAAWRRALSAAEAGEFNSRPWHLLKPDPIRRYFFPAGGAQTIVVGLTDETDSAFAVSKLKARAIGLTTEADSVLAAAKLKAKAIGLTTEADSPLAPGKAKALTVGLNTETDEALPFVLGTTYPVGQATEADTALATGRSKAKATGQALEADSALATLYGKLKSVGIATETATALAVTRVRRFLVGLASETSSAFSLSKLKAKLVGLALENDHSLDATVSGGTGPTGPAYLLTYPLVASIARELIKKARGRTHKLFWGDN